MIAIDPLFSLIRKLWSKVNSKRRRQFIFLAVLMVFSSFAEVLSIGAVIPFLSVLTSPQYFYDLPKVKAFLPLLNISSADQLLLPLTILFSVAVLVSSLTRMLLLWVTTRLSFLMVEELSLEVYTRTLYQPYEVHLSRNSSEVIDSISTKTNNIIYYLILPLVSLVSNTFLVVIIFIALVFINPIIAVIVFGVLGLIYGTIIFLTKKKILSAGKKISSESTHLIKSLQEGLGGIRDVLIENSQNIYIQKHLTIERSLRRAQASATFVGQCPRFGIEAFGMILIAVVAFIFSKQSNGVTAVVPLLGAFALAAQRLLPALNQSFQGLTIIRSMQPTLKAILDMLDQNLPKTEANDLRVQLIPFKKHIRFNNISYSYSKQDIFSINKFNLEIPKGCWIGFIGETGSGKSTLLDILMGLLNPSSGNLEIDGLRICNENKLGWQKHIAHVPQTIFLNDCSIAQNIAFGVSETEIDYARVKLVAQQAMLKKVVESLPDQYQTAVGEKGIRLSGGQRQRIGIARALYKKADVIIFDEATSALDSDTESELMASIRLLPDTITVIMVAHRISTLKDCDMIVKIANGEILKVGKYKDFCL